MEQMSHSKSRQENYVDALKKMARTLDYSGFIPF